MNTITNECPICGKCSMSISNQYCSEHKYLGENTYEHLLDEILHWHEWKLKAALDTQLFSPRVEHKILQHCNKMTYNK